MILENPDGTESTTEIKKGNAYIREAGVRHNVINASEKLMVFIEIELKS
jgi:mannose-6-phosphate isomerase-like protein (cupin superfamily)